MKNKTKLIGSASNLERLKLQLENYFCSVIHLKQTTDKHWRVYNSEKMIQGFIVTQKQNRYRFEMERDNEK